MDKVAPRLVHTATPTLTREQHGSEVSVEDIRLPKALRLSKSNLMRLCRPMSLMVADAGALFLTAFSIRQACNYLGVSCLNLASSDVVFIALSSICLMWLINSYGAGDSRRNYIGISTVLLLNSLLALHLSHRGLVGVQAPSIKVRVVEILTVWGISATLVGFNRYVTDQIVDLLRRRKTTKNSALHYRVLAIAEPCNHRSMESLINSESRYNLIEVNTSESLDRANRTQFINRVISSKIDEIFVDWLSIERRPFLFQYLKSSGATVRVMTFDSSINLKNLALIKSDNSLTAFTLHSDPPLISLFVLKRFADIFASALALALLFAPLLFVSILIKIDSPGPVFYKQTRVGLKGREFKVWKFRSMVPDADCKQALLEQKNESGDGILFKIKDDPRITKLGVFLRKYSIDELPQLINVLFGQMSIVGPRPLPIRDVQKFSEKSFFIRHEVLPGITGLWQVSGRSDIEDFNQAVRLDMSYIENWSLGLDFRIILKTIFVVLRKEGAY